MFIPSSKHKLCSSKELMGYNVFNDFIKEQLKFEKDEKRKDDLLADLHSCFKDHETINSTFGL